MALTYVYVICKVSNFYTLLHTRDDGRVLMFEGTLSIASELYIS